MLHASKKELISSLKLLLELLKKQKTIKLKELFAILSGRGYSAFLIIFSLPFCLFLQIPGLSTPFGIILAFLGIRLAFAKHYWWPKWILKKRVSGKTLTKIFQAILKILQQIKFLLHPRLRVLTQNLTFRFFHGLLVFILAILLALPLPIPLTNFIPALPILFIGLGLLEDDGLFIIIGYLLAFISFGLFLGLFIWGGSI